MTQDDPSIDVSIAPSVGNKAFIFRVNGKPVIFDPPEASGDILKLAAAPGIPFLAPWANRLDGFAFWANDKKYILNPDLNSIHYDEHHLPIHGLLGRAEWDIVDVKADGMSAEVTSRLEFWKHPDWMAQFPFAHTVYMTYRLSKGVLQVETKIENHSTDPMPVSIGYHPYFQINDAPRDQWTIHAPAREHLLLNSSNIPTGEKEPVHINAEQSLHNVQFDDLFGALEPDKAGEVTFWVKGVKEKISVVYGPKFRNAVIFAPPGRNFICFEPMSGPTNAFNLAHAGLYKELQTIPPGGQWQESFWIKTDGF